jgi:hypothetical protein
MRLRPIFLILIMILAFGFVAAGCGGDDSTSADVTSLDGVTAPEDISVPQDAQDAIDEAQQQLEDAQGQLGDVPENLDEAVQQCIDQAESSGLPSDQAQSLKDLCESAGEAAGGALGN